MKRTCLLASIFLGLVAGACVAAEMPGAPSVLPFIQNDYDRALAEARARNVPLFIEVWAPW